MNRFTVSDSILFYFKILIPLKSTDYNPNIRNLVFNEIFTRTHCVGPTQILLIEVHLPEYSQIYHAIFEMEILAEL